MPTRIWELVKSGKITGTHVNLENARRLRDFVSRLDYITIALVIKRTVVGSIEAICSHFYRVPWGNKHVLRIGMKCFPPANVDSFQQRQYGRVQIGQGIWQAGTRMARVCAA